MVNWYSSLTVELKWQTSYSAKIDVQIGTRQGGLTSPMLFNLFYEDLVEALSNTSGGIVINGTSYNVFCYADDLVLTSLSSTGLQELIDVALSYNRTWSQL